MHRTLIIGITLYDVSKKGELVYDPMQLVQKRSYLEKKRGTYDGKTRPCSMIFHAVSGASGVEEEDGKDEDNMMEEEVDRSLHLKVSLLAWKRRWTDLFISR